MAKIFVYDAYSNRFEIYNRSENSTMPYAYGTSLKVKEFRGSSESPTLWTTTNAMEAWNLTRRSYGGPIHVGYAFKRIWEGGHGTRSQHYAGVAFDVGQGQGSAVRNRIWRAAYNSGAWGYVGKHIYAQPALRKPVFMRIYAPSNGRGLGLFCSNPVRFPRQKSQFVCTDPPV